jgi:hypothetical protein
MKSAAQLGEIVASFRTRFIFQPLPSREPSRSAAPLAAVAIQCLGLVPTLGGPDRPLHWAMTAGMVGFGALLLVRHRLQRREGPLPDVPAPVAREAGRAFFITLAVIALLLTGFFVVRWNPHGSTALLSLALPAAGLAWLTAIGLRVRRHGAEAPAAEAAAIADRPSRRPSNWDALSNAGSGHGKASTHASL